MCYHFDTKFEPKRGHCNGTLYIVTQVSTRLIYAMQLWCNANDLNTMILIPKIPIHTNQDDLTFILNRIQCPVQIAYVILRIKPGSDFH